MPPDVTTPPSASFRRSKRVLPSADAREGRLSIYAFLTALSIPWRTHAHAAGLYREERRNCAANLAGLCTANNLVSRRPPAAAWWLVVAREDLKLDLAALSTMRGAPRFKALEIRTDDRDFGYPRTARSRSPFFVGFLR